MTSLTKQKMAVGISAIAASLLVTAGLTGCLGGGSSTTAATPASTDVTGFVVGGAPQAAKVIICGSGTALCVESSTSDASTGAYSVSIATLGSGPYILRTTLTDGVTTYYSILPASGTSVNLTPVTTAIAILAVPTIKTLPMNTTGTQTALPAAAAANITSTVITNKATSLVKLLQAVYDRMVVATGATATTLTTSELMSGAISTNVGLDKVLANITLDTSAGLKISSKDGTQLVNLTTAEITAVSSLPSSSSTALYASMTGSTANAAAITISDETGLLGTGGLVEWLQKVFRAEAAATASGATFVTCTGGNVSGDAATALFNPCATTVAKNPLLEVSGVDADHAGASIRVSAVSGTDVTIGGLQLKTITTSETGAIIKADYYLLWTKGSSTGRFTITAERASKAVSAWKISGFSQL